MKISKRDKALLWAVRKRNLRLVKYFINGEVKGVYEEKELTWPRSYANALFLATKLGYTDVAECLLPYYDKFDMFWSVYIAINNNMIDMIKLFISKKIDIIDVLLVSHRNITESLIDKLIALPKDLKFDYKRLFMGLVKASNSELVKYMLESGIDLSDILPSAVDFLIDHVWYEDMIYLFIDKGLFNSNSLLRLIESVCECQRYDVFQHLFEKGLIDSSNLSAVIRIILNNKNSFLLNYLMDKNLINYKEYVKELSSFVCETSSKDGVSNKVLSNLLKCDGFVEIYGEDYLIGACMQGRYDFVDTLISAGVNVNARNGAPLSLALVNGHKEIANRLILAGAQMTFADMFQLMNKGDNR